MTDERITELETMFNEKAPLAQSLGLALVFDDQRRAVITMPYNAGYDHALGSVHGGVYMSLIDSAAWFTAAAAHDESIWVATSELTVHLLKPVRGLALRAVGSLIQAGSRLDIAEAYLYDENDQLVAHGVGTFVVLDHISTRR